MKMHIYVGIFRIKGDTRASVCEAWGLGVGQPVAVVTGKRKYCGQEQYVMEPVNHGDQDFVFNIAFYNYASF